MLLADALEAVFGAILKDSRSLDAVEHSMRSIGLW